MLTREDILTSDIGLKYMLMSRVGSFKGGSGITLSKLAINGAEVITFRCIKIVENLNKDLTHQSPLTSIVTAATNKHFSNVALLMSFI